MEHDEPYSIGVAAAATGLTVKAIRHYEEVGLIPRPRRHDGNARTGGNRLYTEEELARLRFVRQARLEALLAKGGSKRVQHCAGDGCGCLGPNDSNSRKRSNRKTNAGRSRQKKSHNSGLP